MIFKSGRQPAPNSTQVVFPPIEILQRQSFARLEDDIRRQYAVRWARGKPTKFGACYFETIIPVTIPGLLTDILKALEKLGCTVKFHPAIAAEPARAEIIVPDKPATDAKPAKGAHR